MVWRGCVGTGLLFTESTMRCGLTRKRVNDDDDDSGGALVDGADIGRGSNNDDDEGRGGRECDSGRRLGAVAIAVAAVGADSGDADLRFKRDAGVVGGGGSSPMGSSKAHKGPGIVRRLGE